MQDEYTHLLKIPLSDVMAGVAKSFDSELNSEAMQVPGGDHCHRIELTAEDFTTLKNGGVVKKPTCNGGDHEFVLSCGDDPPAPVNPSSCPGGDNAGTCG